MSTKSRHTKRVVCFGDSITEGFDLPVNLHWPGILARRLQSSGSPVEEIFTRGVGGDTAGMAMDRINRHLDPLLPALVLIEFGINDSYVYPWSTQARASVDQFDTQMRAIIHFIRSKDGSPVLINNHPLLNHPDKHQQGNGRTIGENLLPYRKVLINLGNELTVPVIDLESLLGRNFVQALHPDGIHLTSASSILYGEAVADGLLQCFESDDQIRESFAMR